MMIDPNLEVTTILGWLREITIITGVVVIGWKARGAIQPVIDFVDDIKSFMMETRTFMQVVQTNHLTHIEKALAKMAGTEYKSDEPQV
jgi:hypothetical protein